MKKKQLTSILLAVALAAGTLTGCGAQKDAQPDTTAQEDVQSSETAVVPEVEGTITLKDGAWSDVYFNEEYKDEGMKTVKGKEISTDDAIIVEEAGGGGVFPKTWIDSVCLWDYFIPADGQVEFYVFRTEDVAKMNELQEAYELGNISSDEIGDAYYAIVDAAYRLFGIYSRDAGDQAALFSDSDFGTVFSYAEKIGTFGGREYYFVYNDTTLAEGFSDEDIADMGKMLDALDEVRENLVLFPPHEHDYEAEKTQMKEQVSGIDLSDFEVTDLNGNTVTQDIFKDYDITMVNIWATWCGPCREELPEIQAAYEKLPENANIISICQDAAEEAEIANAIVDKSGMTYTILVPDEQMEQSVLSLVDAFPTTIFVDREGHVVGDAVIGVPSGDDVTQAYLDCINSALEQ